MLQALKQSNKSDLYALIVCGLSLRQFEQYSIQFASASLISMTSSFWYSITVDIRLVLRMKTIAKSIVKKAIGITKGAESIDLSLYNVLQLTYAKYTNKNRPNTRVDFGQIHQLNLDLFTKDFTEINFYKKINQTCYTSQKFRGLR